MTSLIPYVTALIGAGFIALAFPRANVAIGALIGAAALFWTWFGLTPKRAFLTGWLAGTAFFAVVHSWITETIGTIVAPFGPLVVLVPSALEGLSYGVAGALAAIAVRRAHPALAPLAAAAGFAFLEWLRSVGPFGVPFGGLSYPLVETPLAPLATYVGCFGLTAFVAILAAYPAATLAAVNDVRRFTTTLRATAAVYLVAIVVTALAWTFWPARMPAPAHTIVAAAQGNVRQLIKWQRSTFDLSVSRYVSLSTLAAAKKPVFILWPETVVTESLNLDPALEARLGALAKRLHTGLIVGSLQTLDGTPYNALYFFEDDGTLNAIYRKRRLVPFVETLPGARFLSAVPGASLISRFGAGNTPGVTRIGGVRVAPLICWESAFSDLAVEGVRDGAQALAISTDDAWFGETAGPFQHAQIAQMRAIETGTWVVRAAATGISGIIAPTGRYIGKSKIDTLAVIGGSIGPPVEAPYVAIGSAPVAAVLAFAYAAIVIPRRRRRP